MKKQAFDIDKLLKPFRKSGSEENPKPLTLETIFDCLANHYNYAPDIVARAVWKTFYEMSYRCKEFKGDGNYGSRAKELLQYLKVLCWEIRGTELKEKINTEFKKQAFCVRGNCPKRTHSFEKLTRWQRFVRFFLKPRIWWRI